MATTTKINVGGIMNHQGLATVNILSLPNRPDASGLVLHVLGEKNINIEFLVHNRDREGNSNLTLCIHQKNLEQALAVLEEVKPLTEARGLSSHPNVAVISVFGPHFRDKPMISGLMFKALGSAGVPILAISTSISTCSCLVHGDDAEAAVVALHETFEAPHQIAVFAP